MLELVTLPDLSNPVSGDYVLAWRGIVPNRLNLSHFPARSGGFFGFGTTSPFCMLHSSASVPGGAPATSGTIDTNVFARLQGGSVGLDFGVRASGATWIQPRLVSNLATNFALELCPNGGNVSTGPGTLTCNGSTILAVPAAGWVAGQTASVFVGDALNGFSATNGGVTAMRAFNGLRIETGAGSGRWDFLQAGSLVPVVDGGPNVGSGSLRIGTYFGVTGTINTSDEREKLWRGAPTDAELDAAWQCFNELGFYQWNDAVEEKGEDRARYHFGLRAQRVWQIFAASGLVDPIAANGKPGAAAYALFCYDEWGDEFETIFEERDVSINVEVDQEYDSEIVGPDGEAIKKTRKVLVPQVIRLNVDTGEKRQTRVAGNRFGFRPDQLDRLMMAALKRQSDRQEARIAELEAR